MGLAVLSKLVNTQGVARASLTSLRFLAQLPEDPGEHDIVCKPDQSEEHALRYAALMTTTASKVARLMHQSSPKSTLSQHESPA